MKIKKTRFTRLFVLFIVPFMAVFMMQPVKVYADDKEYTVDSAEFDVEYESGGAAVITEKWDVTYIKGDFTRFYKDINNPANNLEHFDGVQVLSCSVDGVEAEASSSVDRVDYHYFYENNTSSVTDTIHWFLHASDRTVHYEIKYRIENSVKLDENNNAVFCYRFIGVNFPKTVGRTLIKAEIPGNTENVIVTCSDGDYYFDGSTLVANAVNVSGILKLRVEMDSSAFSGLSRVIDGKYSDTEESDDDFPWLLVLGIAAFILFWPVLIIYIIVCAVKSSAGYRKIKKSNPDFLADSARKLESYNVPLMWLGLINSHVSVLYVYNFTFAAEIMDLCSRKVLKLDHDGIRTDNQYYCDDPVISKYDNEFIEILKRNICKHDGLSGENEIFIPYAELSSVMDDKSQKSKLYNEVSAWVKKYRKAYINSDKYKQLAASGAVKEIKKELKIWHWYSDKELNKIDCSQCMDIIQRNGYLSVFSFLNLLYAYNKYADRNEESTNKRDSLCYFCYCLDSELASKSSSSSSDSSSGCSSCSSCSSCSGCGGGGAD